MCGLFCVLHFLKYSNILDAMSSKSDPLSETIARRVRAMRAAHAMSLEALAEKSGVSRSMISLIERAETSATAVVLDRIAAAFGCSITDFFEDELRESTPIARRADQPVWRDPESGYVRRMLSPQQHNSSLDLIEVRFPPGARVAYLANRSREIHQQLWLIAGSMEITIDHETFSLHAGDCFAMDVGVKTSYFNPGKQTARYLIASLRGAASLTRRG